jgi:UPF0755 protein
MKQQKPGKRKRSWWWVPVFLMLGLGILGSVMAFSGNVQLAQRGYLYIPTNSTYEQVRDSLRAHGILAWEGSFEILATLVGYSNGPVYPGRYTLEPGMSNYHLLRNLGGGHKDEVRLVIHTRRTLPDQLSRTTAELEMTEEDLLRELARPGLLDSLGLDSLNVIQLFLPATHRVYWDVQPDDLASRLVGAYRNFWTAARRRKAQALGLTPQQVGVLASIVEAETQQNSEKPRMAGVYLNRLKQDMKLQADPTVIFAIGDFTITRVLNEHLRYDSPYNTYRYKGLPPGCINNPSQASLEAVLNPEQHNYLYFVAQPGGTGLHDFSADYDEHLRKAARYIEWLESIR